MTINNNFVSIKSDENGNILFADEHNNIYQSDIKYLDGKIHLGDSSIYNESNNLYLSSPNNIILKYQDKELIINENIFKQKYLYNESITFGDNDEFKIYNNNNTTIFQNLAKLQIESNMVLSATRCASRCTIDPSMFNSAHRSWYSLDVEAC